MADNYCVPLFPEVFVLQAAARGRRVTKECFQWILETVKEGDFANG